MFKIIAGLMALAVLVAATLGVYKLGELAPAFMHWTGIIFWTLAVLLGTGYGLTSAWLKATYHSS